MISSAYYNGTEVFASSTLPLIFVDYGGGTTCCVDDLGSGSTLKIAPAKANVSGGFQITATYCFGSCKPTDSIDAFSYKYAEGYTFLSNGEWTAKLSIYGPGLQASATYETFWRVDYDIISSSSDNFQRFNAGAWAPVASEAEFTDDGGNAPGGYEWRQYDGSHTYEIDPLSATAPYADLALLYHAGETGGTGGQKNYPVSLYANNENVTNADIVQWHHGFRVYTRPAGCVPGGVGCTTSFPVSFRAIAIAY